MSNHSTLHSAPVPTAPASARQFVWQRFAALLRVDWAERWRTYAAFAAVMLVVHALVVMLIGGFAGTISPMDLGTQMGLYYSLLLVFLAAFCCVLFGPMQRQGAALLSLMRPASTLEKWLHAALMLLVLLPVAYTVVFWLVYAPANAIAAAAEGTRNVTEWAAGTVPGTRDGFQLFVPLRPMGATAAKARDFFAGQMILVWAMLVLAGVGVYTQVKFKRAAAIKALGLALILLLCTLLLLSLGRGEPWALFDWLKPRELRGVGALPWIAKSLFWGLTPLLLWVASFYAWRERDLV